ncbi:putative ALG-2 interacting protein X [Paratrimastix pyriformis]|uniref:ALG-2 interacting protein X n=1 Tax=Paratrimastix pyriformis TaxID=342808 RepID=A0ABQ8UGS3_9EUKA|nr:putative ALG-2 interacting protein X [Paratrimastix pyriformis]
MLAINKKYSLPVDMAKAFKAYMKKQRQERDLTRFQEHFDALDALRNEILQNIQGDRNDALHDSAARYLSLLCSIETRLPFGTPEINLTWTWMDAFDPRKKVADRSIFLEKAGVMFNLGACLSYEGVTSNRTTPDGMKAAVRLLQQAAGWFEYLRQYLHKVPLGSLTLDLSDQGLQLLTNLMLAQAMEIYYEKAAADNVSLVLQAQLAQAVSDLYQQTHMKITTGPLATHFDKSWYLHAEVKWHYFAAKARYTYSLTLRDALKYGEELGHLYTARRHLADLDKVSKSLEPQMRDLIGRLSTAIVADLTQLEADNAKIYNDPVPRPEALPVVPVLGRTLVKPALPEDPAPPAEDPFRDLVPVEVVQAASVYTDMVADIVRKEIASMSESTALAKSQVEACGAYRQLEVAESQGAGGLPDTLAAKCVEVQHQGGAPKLATLRQEMEDLRRECRTIMDRTAAELGQRAQRADVVYRGPSVEKYVTELSVFEEKLTQANKSDDDVRGHLALWEAFLTRLTQEQDPARLLDETPAGSPAQRGPSPHVAPLKEALQQLKTLFESREALAGQLQKTAAEEHIVESLLQHLEVPHQQIFDQERTKYQPLVEQSQATLAAQQAILGRVMALKRLGDGCKAFEDIKEHLRQAVQFYTALLERLKSFHQRCLAETRPCVRAHPLPHQAIVLHHIWRTRRLGIPWPGCTPVSTFTSYAIPSDSMGTARPPASAPAPPAGYASPAPVLPPATMAPGSQPNPLLGGMGGMAPMQMQPMRPGMAPMMVMPMMPMGGMQMPQQQQQQQGGMGAMPPQMMWAPGMQVVYQNPSL